jgi:DNA-binding MarR family transcriptional regulator
MTHEYLIKQSIERRKEDDKVHLILKTHGLNRGEWMIIGLVHDGPKTGTNVARLMGTSLAYVSRAVTDLCKSGWLEHITEDQRNKVITFAGDEKKYKRIEKYVEEAINGS